MNGLSKLFWISFESLQIHGRHNREVIRRQGELQVEGNESFGFSKEILLLVLNKKFFWLYDSIVASSKKFVYVIVKQSGLASTLVHKLY